MSYVVSVDEFRSKLFKHEVYDFICLKCGEVADSNSNFDRKPTKNFCDNCGEKLDVEVVQ